MIIDIIAETLWYDLVARMYYIVMPIYETG